MRFLADESCDFAVVRALRESGHDVLAVSEFARGSKDPAVIALAREGRRILLTEDKDFGWLVYAAGHGGIGVLFFRFPANARQRMAAAALDAVSRFGDELSRSFTVVEPGRFRMGSPEPRDV